MLLLQLDFFLRRHLSLLFSTPLLDHPYLALSPLTWAILRCKGKGYKPLGHSSKEWLYSRNCIKGLDCCLWNLRYNAIFFPLQNGSFVTCCCITVLSPLKVATNDQFQQFILYSAPYSNCSDAWSFLAAYLFLWYGVFGSCKIDTIEPVDHRYSRSVATWSEAYQLCNHLKAGMEGSESAPAVVVSPRCSVLFCCLCRGLTMGRSPVRRFLPNMQTLTLLINMIKGDRPRRKKMTEHIGWGCNAPTCVRNVPGSILGWDTDYPDWDFRGLPQCLQENAGIVPCNWPLQLSSTFSIHRPLIFQPLDCV